MSYRRIHKIFIANRGEIAYRIIQTASRMGISTIVPITRGEQETLPAKAANEIHVLDSSLLNETYLNAKYMLQLALQYGADAVHPGYGFLSESAPFAEMVENSGLLWIGPSPNSISAMGNKLTARLIAEDAGVSMTKAISGNSSEIMESYPKLRFPLLIKAAAGGGGKGMKVAVNPDELQQMLKDASREALSYFGDGTVFVEEYIEDPRHIEIQVLGDHQGNMVHLFERECSIQRRYQKIIEESPSSFTDEGLRQRLVKDALDLCRQIGYYNAGTVEFLVDARGSHYFLEMNTRLQVEHPVTEAITGIDLIEEQIKIATGFPLSFSQKEITATGHAIEARIYAEDALANFNPAPGDIHHVQWPDSKIARTDTFFSSNTEIQSCFDPMLAKITTKGNTREEAINQLLRSLSQTSVLGIPTNLPYLIELLKTEAFTSGDTTTHFTSAHHEILVEAIHPNGIEKTRLLMAAYVVWLKRYRHSNDENIWTRLGHKRWNGLYDVILNGQLYQINIRQVDNSPTFSWALNNHEMENIQNIQFSENYMRFLFHDKWQQLIWYADKRELLLGVDGHTYRLTPGFFLNPNAAVKTSKNHTNNQITAPIPGKISRIFTSEGSLLKKDTPMLILEAMKMENTINAPQDGVLEEILVKEGDQVKAGQILAVIEKEMIEIKK